MEECYCADDRCKLLSHLTVNYGIYGLSDRRPHTVLFRLLTIWLWESRKSSDIGTFRKRQRYDSPWNEKVYLAVVYGQTDLLEVYLWPATVLYCCTVPAAIHTLYTIYTARIQYPISEGNIELHRSYECGVWCDSRDSRLTPTIVCSPHLAQAIWAVILS